MEGVIVKQTPVQPKKAYKVPKIVSELPSEAPLFLACTGRIDCGGGCCAAIQADCQEECG